jgi:peroxiredoxin Q/BCP
VRNLILIVLGVAVLTAIAFVTVHAGGQANQPMPSTGQVAPGFTLPSQDGSQIALSSFRGKWVVLYFYPKDMTPGCTIEAHNFQRDLAQFEARNAVVLGVSEDTPGSHQQFCTKEGLTFRLLADTGHTVAAAYGSLGNYAGFQVANRNTFLIDPQGTITNVWTKVNPSTSSTTVLAAIPAGQSTAKPAQPQNLTAKPQVQ